MLIIHVSGNPGSGKTTMGKKLQLLEGVEVVDTDEIFTEQDEDQVMALWNDGKTKEARELWKETFSKRLVDAAHSHENATVLVFTGILNHGNLEGQILEMPFKNVEKYFIDISPAQLLRQFYGRLAKLLAEDNTFAEEIANNRWTVESSVDYLAQSQREKQWHLNSGYKLVPVTNIYEEIRTTLFMLK